MLDGGGGAPSDSWIPLHSWVSSTLLGRDLLSKLGAQVTFSLEERPTFRMDTMTYLLCLNTTPRWVEVAWASEGRTRWAGRAWERANSINPFSPRLAKHQAAVIIEFKRGTILVRKRQYQLPIETWTGMLPHINRLKQAVILIECQLTWNTPILPVKKEGGQDYRPVQDLR